MKLALHRSITFWSGLLVMGFVCWEWQDSYRYDSWVTAHGNTSSSFSGGLCFGVNLDDAGIHAGREYQAADLLRNETFPPFLFVRGKGMKEYSEHAPDLPTVRELWAEISQISPTSTIRLFLPYWCILLAVTVAWFGLLFWRARRRAAAAKQLEG